MNKRAELFEETWEEVEEGEMPMKAYVLLHSTAGLTAEDQGVLRRWALALEDHSDN